MRREISGFTLVELIIALLVLAVLASLAAPSFVQTVDNRRLSGAAEEAKNAMILARSEAFKRGVETCLSLDPSDEPWVNVELASADPCGDECAANGDGCLMQGQLSAYRGVTAAGGLQGAVFDPVRGTVTFVDGAGAPVPGSLQTVDLVSARGSELDVRLNIMGRAQICAPTGAQGTLSLGYALCPSP